MQMTPSSCRGVLARCLLTVLALTVVPTMPVAAQNAQPLTARIARAITEEGWVGATWALVTPDSITLGAAGQRDLARNSVVQPHDRVQVGSVAKVFVAVGVLRLVTEGRVKLDAPVALYLPNVSVDNPWRTTSPVLVRHLLDHTAGLDDARLWQVFTIRASPDDPLRHGLVRDGSVVRVRHRPGARFSYSNTGFVLAAMVIEAVTRERYETWLNRELLAPIGMTRSTVSFVTQVGTSADTTLAMGHFDSRITAPTTASPLRPATQLTTTAADMAQFARFLMSDGRVDGRVLIDGTLLHAMGVPTTTEAARAGLAAGYGLGLARRDRHGAVGRCHLGNSGTFRAALCIFPEQQRAYVVSHNTDPENANFGRVDSLLTDALGLTGPTPIAPAPLTIDPSDWDGLYLVRPNRFDQFAYLDALGSVTRVRWEGNTLHLRPWQGVARELLPVAGASFRLADRREASHVLLRSADGAVVVADGQRTLERVRPMPVYLLWASAIAGVAGLLYLLLVGGFRTARALRRRAWRTEPLRWPAVSVVLLVVTPALYLTQPAMALGDPTLPNVAMTLVTALLPIALFVGVMGIARRSERRRMDRIDLLALGGALQWCAVLAWWELLPVTLWR